ncbi:enoyl-CoA hydratase/isomerase family protein [Ammoniphilus sp. CFH 90114]|uniref:enoyl-CoA hydratase/isomerase family protein n=1 Tax=Ammoniphilus sp. CFH 90114 TaxID=2493665 RepID=UPI0013E8F76B|nr:enoyl-CoA hydratase/isomerase family protein [Ammoniphilus sp. CFH 90114]
MFQVTEHSQYTHIQFSHDKGNSIDLPFIHRFMEVLDTISEKTSVLIIEGTPHFSVGMNLQQLAHLAPLEVTTLFATYEKFLNKLETAPFITIAKITGYAMGAGAELALSCDFRWMEQKAKIGFPGVNVGFTYNTKRLQRLIPLQIAKRLVLSGSTINGQLALSYGIADRIASHKRIDQELEEYAIQFAGKSPIAIKYAKEAFLELGSDVALLRSIEAEHYHEGALAFIEGRPPQWDKF